MYPPIYAQLVRSGNTGKTQFRQVNRAPVPSNFNRKILIAILFCDAIDWPQNKRRYGYEHGRIGHQQARPEIQK